MKVERTHKSVKIIFSISEAVEFTKFIGSVRRKSMREYMRKDFGKEYFLDKAGKLFEKLREAI